MIQPDQLEAGQPVPQENTRRGFTLPRVRIPYGVVGIGLPILLTIGLVQFAGDPTPVVPATPVADGRGEGTEGEGQELVEVGFESELIEGAPTRLPRATFASRRPAPSKTPTISPTAESVLAAVSDEKKEEIDLPEGADPNLVSYFMNVDTEDCVNSPTRVIRRVNGAQAVAKAVLDFFGPSVAHAEALNAPSTPEQLVECISEIEGKRAFYTNAAKAQELGFSPINVKALTAENVIGFDTQANWHGTLLAELQKRNPGFTQEHVKAILAANITFFNPVTQQAEVFTPIWYNTEADADAARKGGEKRARFRGEVIAVIYDPNTNQVFFVEQNSLVPCDNGSVPVGIKRVPLVASPTASRVPTQTPTFTATPKPVDTATAVPTNTPKPVDTLVPTNTPKPAPTNTPRPVPTNTPVPTERPTITPQPTAHDTPTPGITGIETPGVTDTRVATATQAPGQPSVTPAPQNTIVVQGKLPEATALPNPTRAATEPPKPADTRIPTAVPPTAAPAKPASVAPTSAPATAAPAPTSAPRSTVKPGG